MKCTAYAACGHCGVTRDIQMVEIIRGEKLSKEPRCWRCTTQPKRWLGWEPKDKKLAEMAPTPS